MILTCEGEVFFATHSIEGYLGFHQVRQFRQTLAIHVISNFIQNINHLYTEDFFSLI